MSGGQCSAPSSVGGERQEFAPALLIKALAIKILDMRRESYIAAVAAGRDIVSR
ncbi:hypothetical protein GCM10010151_47640 [Actinoallomurus spadix]|uniref:Transposase n=1 Tax=Actinoallomurus spadix TaxID=79912 RepID=A0ABN0X198_9ACTN